MTVKQHNANQSDLKGLVAEDRDLMKTLMKQALQEVLETEMTELLGAGPHERQEGRQGYRAGYYERGLVTRIGKLELRVPRDRNGQFQTAVFERYQRSEKALWPPWRRCTCKASPPARSKRSQKSSVGIVSRPPASARSTRGSMRPSQLLPSGA